MRAVSLQTLREILAVALDAHVVHQVAPLLLEQVFATLQAVEEKVAGAAGEVVGVVVAGAVELEGDVGVDPHREVVVEYIEGLEWNL